VKRFHLIFGLLLFIGFVLTGQYMDKWHDHLRGMSDGPRMLYRSRHIYILLAGMLHLGIGAYFKYQLDNIRRILQIGGSLLITIASLLFIYAFFEEPAMTNLYTPYSRKGIFILVGGTALHVFANLKSAQAGSSQ
jgi:hypothetical protein